MEYIVKELLWTLRSWDKWLRFPFSIKQSWPPVSPEFLRPNLLQHMDDIPSPLPWTFQPRDRAAKPQEPFPIWTSHFGPLPPFYPFCVLLLYILPLYPLSLPLYCLFTWLRGMSILKFLDISASDYALLFIYIKLSPSPYLGAAMTFPFSFFSSLCYLYWTHRNFGWLFPKWYSTKFFAKHSHCVRY